MAKVAKDTDQLFENLSMLMTPIEVADLLRVHRKTIYRWIHDGHLPAHRMRGEWRIEPEEVRKLAGLKG